MPDRDMRAAVSNVARQNTFHPIRDRLRSFQWDGTPRLDSMFVDYLGCADNEYHRQAARLFLLGAVARVMTPGCKFDFVPILEGGQGIGKSTWVAILGLDWAGSFAVDFHDNNRVIEAMQGAWILELPELQGFSKAETNTLKAMLTRTHDKGRLAWERNVQEFPRQCVFIGSTNETDYLRDTTGARRFWPIVCKPEQIDNARFRKNVEQIWAEAVAVYDKMRAEQPGGDLRLFLDSQAAIDIALQLQASRQAESPEVMLAEEFRRVLDAPVSTTLEGESEPRTVTCAREVWCDLLNRDERELSNRMTTALIGKAMRIAGWESMGRTYRHPKYGSIKGYRRKAA